MRLVVKQQRHQQQHVLQRQHIEIGVIILSGCRLCAAVAYTRGSGALLAATVLAIIHILSLVLEFGSCSIGSPYRLRRSASHGIAQGVLAVPSVLAALVAAAPTDGWQPWLEGSCSAAVATLAVIYFWRQPASPSTAAGSNAPTPHTSKPLASQSNGCGLPPGMHGNSPSNWQAAYRKLSRCSAASGSGCLTAAGFVCMLAVAGRQHQYLWPSLQQILPLPGWLAGLFWPMLQTSAWACLSALGFCLSLQLLPGCFSLGEAALMAQGTACLGVTTAGALRHAALFAPEAVCSCLPQAVLLTLRHFGGCTGAAHSEALSMQLLPAVICLILAAAVAACLLLRVLVAASQQLGGLVLCSQTVPRLNKQPACVSKATNVVSHHAASNGHQNGNCVREGGTPSRRNKQIRKLDSTPSMAVTAALVTASLAASAGMCLLLLWLSCAAVWTLFEFLPAEAGRFGVLLYWVALLAATLPVLKVVARVGSMPQIVVRKVYHLLAMSLFVPVFFWDVQLLGLSLAIAFAALVLLEVLRCLRLPLLGQAVQDFMQEFVDERDAGAIYITHFTLLLGLAVPVWSSLVMPGAQVQLTPHSPARHHVEDSNVLFNLRAAAGSAIFGRSRYGWADASSALLQATAGLSGLIIIGVGDTAASFVGKLFGRVPVHDGSSKTVEGTLAGICGSLGAWILLLWAVQLLSHVCSWYSLSWWLQLVLATSGAGLMEAATSQLDNILLPLWYLPHLLLIVV